MSSSCLFVACMTEPAVSVDPNRARALREKYARRLARFDEVNASKLAYARTVMSAQSRKFLALLPLLLHYNDPRLPGFRANAPCGIDCFEPDDRQRQWLSAELGEVPAVLSYELRCKIRQAVCRELQQQAASAQPASAQSADKAFKAKGAGASGADISEATEPSAVSGAVASSAENDAYASPALAEAVAGAATDDAVDGAWSDFSSSPAVSAPSSFVSDPSSAAVSASASSQAVSARAMLQTAQMELALTRALAKAAKKQHRAIRALYAMGSTASIGQGSQSDLDIWVCVDSAMPQELTQILADKCRFICVFARGLGVEVSLFVTREDRFTAGVSDNMDSDNCGSAQNLFLLDEFYRTALRLAGRHLSWYLISGEEEKAGYEAALDELKTYGPLREDELFDFGSVVNSSPAEYFGSGLWLLYKGIDYPFKAALKILLMEVYAAEYPQSELLSSHLKDALLSGNGVSSLDIDSYFMMFSKASNYLLARGDKVRLELVRRCFYLKISLGLKEVHNASIVHFRRDLLNSLARSFGWDRKIQEKLENRSLWKIDYISEFYRQLFASLIKSYRALLSFSVRHGIEYAITSDDAAVLSRKLYAAYDQYPGKVIIYNKDFTSSLEENCLTFVRPHRSSLCRQGWHLYTAAADSTDILSSRSVYCGEHLCEVIAWPCFNNLLTRRTRIYVAGDCAGISPEQIRRASYDILHSLNPTLRARVDNNNLRRPRDIKACAVLLNLEKDVTQERRISSMDLNNGSTLCAGRQRLCLVGSVDLVMVNSWGEIHVISMPEGEEGVAEVIATLLRVSKNAADNPEDMLHHLDTIHVFSYAAWHADLIRYDLQSAIRQVFSCTAVAAARQRGSSDLSGRVPDYTFEVGHNTYMARNVGERGVFLVKHDAFGDSFGSFGVHTRYGMRPEYSLQVPPQVDRYSNTGIMQYFFAPAEDGWNIYIVDERNEVQIYPHYVGSRAALVNAINRFYTRQSEEEQDQNQMSTHFNLPQYFVLSADLKSIHPFTIMGQKTGH